MQDENVKETGIVKWFNPEKGFGFITAGNKDIFAHYKNIIGKGFRSLAEGDKVEFTISHGIKGLHAENILKL